MVKIIHFVHIQKAEHLCCWSQWTGLSTGQCVFSSVLLNGQGLKLPSVCIWALFFSCGKKLQTRDLPQSLQGECISPCGSKPSCKLPTECQHHHSGLMKSLPTAIHFWGRVEEKREGFGFSHQRHMGLSSTSAVYKCQHQCYFDDLAEPQHPPQEGGRNGHGTWHGGLCVGVVGREN